jgi:sugar phosphate isomerase/epimerase
MKRTYLNPAAVDKEERAVAVDTLKRTVELTRRLGESFEGIPKMVVHPGGITLKPYENKKELLEIFKNTLEQLQKDGIEVVPENLPPRAWVFGGEWVTNIWMLADEIEPFLQETGYRMTLDTSHLALACNAYGRNLEDEVKRLKPYVGHLHVADAAGLGDEGLQIGKGDINWKKIMSLLDGYQETMIPEIWQGHLHNGRGFLQAMEHLKPYLK